jgi:hypothetical protein
MLQRRRGRTVRNKKRVIARYEAISLGQLYTFMMDLLKEIASYLAMTRGNSALSFGEGWVKPPTPGSYPRGGYQQCR